MSEALSTPIKAVLFDLDGTLVDTAPDLCGTIVDMQSDRGMDITPLSEMTHLSSGGARALIGKGFGLTPQDAGFAELRAEFLERYEARIARESTLYTGISPLLSDLESRGIVWGIVTNKPYYLAIQLAEQLEGLSGCAVVVGGDSAEAPKPSPAPCLMASQAIRVPARACLMVGDDKRDIDSGKAAGMHTAAVEYGYIMNNDISTWNAHQVFASPFEMASWLKLHSKA